MAEVSYKLSLAEATKMLTKAKDARFFVSVRTELPIAGQPGQVFPGSAAMKISRSQALMLVFDMLKHFDKRNATINIEVHSVEALNCYFIG